MANKFDILRNTFSKRIYPVQLHVIWYYIYIQVEYTDFVWENWGLFMGTAVLTEFEIDQFTCQICYLCLDVKSEWYIFFIIYPLCMVVIAELLIYMYLHVYCSVLNKFILYTISLQLLCEMLVDFFCNVMMLCIYFMLYDAMMNFSYNV